MIDCKNYVITHRDWPIVEDDMYRALCVGKFRNPGWLSEQDGENISKYNDRINEATGLYWIWKNTDSEYVGLSHYRRYFNNHGRRLDRTGVENILVNDGYDIILAPIRLAWPVYENIRMAVDKDLSTVAAHVFLHKIREKHPEYEVAFQKVLHGDRMFICNMFVTRREILNKYCEWLFSFLTDATDLIDVEYEYGFRRRTAGYMAEIMWTVWMEKQNLKVYEMPLEVVR